MVTGTEDSNTVEKYRVMPPLIYPHESENEEDEPPPRQPRGPHEYPSKSPSAEPTSEPGPPILKTTKEPTSETNYNASSEPLVPTREDYIGNLYTGYTENYEKGIDHPQFYTLEECIKETPRGETCKIMILGQEDILEAG